MRTLVLSLPEQPERTERARNHIVEHNLHPEFFCAINGWATGLKSTHPYNHDHPGTNYVIGPATIGIFLSHYIAWAIIEAGRDEHVLVLEDDVILKEGFVKQMNQALLDVAPDWDIIFLGSCCTEGHPMTHVAGNVYRVERAQCLHAYLVNRQAAHILQRNLRDVYGPVDCLMAMNHFFGLKVYAVLPRLAEQLMTELPP